MVEFLIRKPWVAVFFQTGCIFALSSIPGSAFRRISVPLNTDKIVHMAMYGMLGFLLFRALSYSGIFSKSGFLKGYVYAFFYIVSVGACDEFLQRFIPYRNPDFVDYIFDIFGAHVGCLFYYARCRW